MVTGLQCVVVYTFPAIQVLPNLCKCCVLTKEHSDVIGHHLLDCLLDAMYDPFMLLRRWILENNMHE